MQPSSPIAHQTPAFASLPLREAQRAFAPLLEGGACAQAFRFARLRGVARRSLSVLSADDRVRLTRWLALLGGASGDAALACIGQRLANVDAALANAVQSGGSARTGDAAAA